MSGRRFGYILLPTLIVGIFVTLLTATAKFSYQHPNAHDVKFTVTRDGNVVHQPAAASDPAAKAVVNESEHDFGLMNPLTMGAHGFVVRNEGDAPLKLQAGPTSCKCTLSDVSDEPIPPGGESRVTVQWNTGRKNRFYAHEASVYTNDPHQKTLRFSVRGIVRVQMAVDPPEAVFDRLEPDTSASKRLLVYSQVWDDFEILDIQSSLEGFTWQIEPVDAATLAAHEAHSACWLRIMTPSDLPQGQFSGWLQFRLQPAGAPDEAVEHQVALAGKTLKRLAVYGPGIDADGVVTFGAVPSAAGAKKRFLLKIRDAQHSLPVTRVTTTPDFLDVRVIPAEASEGKGLMYLELAIPPGAPRCDYLGMRPASIRIEFDHPRIPDLELTASFAVTN